MVVLHQIDHRGSTTLEKEEKIIFWILWYLTNGIGMDPRDRFRFDIRVPPLFRMKIFEYYKSWMEHFIMMEINSLFILMEDFGVSKDSKGRLLKNKKWIEEKIQKSKENSKVTWMFINILPNDILCKIGEYRNTIELCAKPIKLHEEASPAQKEDESKQGGLLVQEQKYLEVERCSTFKMEDEKVSTSKIEAEYRSLTPKWEKSLTSYANKEEARTTPTTIEGIQISIVKIKITSYGEYC